MHKYFYLIRAVARRILDAMSFYGYYVFGAGRSGAPKQVTIELTYGCNCRCQMCPLYGIHTSGGEQALRLSRENTELTLDEYKKLFSDFKINKIKTVNLTGGEIFLRPDVLDIIKAARDNALNIHFTSNGALITPEIARRLVELGVHSATFSLDAAGDIHDLIRGAKVYEPLMKAVSYISEEKIRQSKTRPAISFACAVSTINQDNFSELVKISKEKNISLHISPVFFSSPEKISSLKAAFAGENFIKPENHVLDKSISGVDADIFYKETARALELSRRLKQPVSVEFKKKGDIYKWFNRPDFFFVNKCFYPWYTARLDPYGNVYPCSISVKMGNIRQTPFMDIWNGQKYTGFRKKLKKVKVFNFCSRCCSLYPRNRLWSYLPKIGF